MRIFLNFLLALAFAGAVAGAVHMWRRQLAAGRRDDLQALAARRGWSLTMTGERLGRAGTLRVAPRGGHPWVVATRPDPRRSAAGATTYEAYEPRWAGGTLVLTPSPHRALPALPGLRPVPAGPGLAALADADPSRRVHLGDVTRVLAGWHPIRRGDGGPVVVLSPAGLRVTLRHPIGRADHLERFVDLAHDLSRVIGP